MYVCMYESTKYIYYMNICAYVCIVVVVVVVVVVGPR